MKIAVIGSGVSGIGAAWALNEYSEHEVHLFEREEYFGGHTHTVPFQKGDQSVNVDTGFIVVLPGYPWICFPLLCSVCSVCSVSCWLVLSLRPFVFVLSAFFERADNRS
jgi:predicted NAD/FAD-binding protein